MAFGAATRGDLAPHLATSRSGQASYDCVAPAAEATRTRGTHLRCVRDVSAVAETCECRQCVRDERARPKRHAYDIIIVSNRIFWDETSNSNERHECLSFIINLYIVVR